MNMKQLGNKLQCLTVNYGKTHHFLLRSSRLLELLEPDERKRAKELCRTTALSFEESVNKVLNERENQYS